LRSGSKLALICGTVFSLVASLGLVSPEATATPASASAADQLRARRAELVAELQALSGPRAQSHGQLLAAEQQLASVQEHLLAARKQLASIDTQMQGLSRQIADDESTVSKAKVQLGTLLRATYEATDADGFAAAILSASSFSDAVDRVRGAQHVTDQVQQLQAQVTGREKALLDERSRLQQDGALAQTLEGQLGEDSNRLMMLVAARDAAFQAVDGPAQRIAAEIADIDQQLAPPPPRPSGSSPCGNRFAYGYCTYYVATRRCIPWLGNAWEWYHNAAAMGYPEGQVPQRGAVAVWGRQGGSPMGHVAFVEAVGPDGGVPAGSYLISEMNYAGWNRVDYRVVKDVTPNLLGFIYG
jgi:surface antigen/peptidoglycan hydrolase CwlO-like protein